ncbi:MAG: glucose-6-phosphate isomerase [Proteobacteria bacterium]|nr:glucose-6-phosphate isomerase [Pseudomonadota bacterium]MBU1685776.1 glucose-6-phosphate isomerase [Pseudomonadota bacterium]
MSFVDLNRLPAYGVLQKLAANPYNLNTPGALTPDRLTRCSCVSGHFTLAYGTQRLDDEVLDALQTLADQSGVVTQFLSMKQGAVLNRIEGFDSECRQVLHTAMRDLFVSNPYCPAATAAAAGELNKLQEFLAELDNGQLTNSRGGTFTDLINVGIGGSDLGPRAVALALKAYQQTGRRVHFISNVDPDDAAGVLVGLDLSRTLVNVVSKSGTTLETLTNEELVRAAFLKEGLEPRHHFLAVTGEKSPMDDPTRYLRSFYMYDYIGGRYSTTSMVGGVLLGFSLGFDNFKELLRGAAEIDLAAEEKDVRRNIPLLLALIGVWNRNFLGHQTLAILPYSQALIRFVAHLQQCDMESNGKRVNRQGQAVSYQTGPVVWGEPGTNGQHAFYQLIHQGTSVIPVEFIGFRKSQYGDDLVVQNTTSQEKLLANLFAQVLALAGGQDSENPNRIFPGNRPSSILMAERLTPRTMGELLAIYENKIAFQGFFWNINSFDQEGVQLGKRLANRLLDHFSAIRGDDSYEGGEGDPVGWAVLHELGLPRDGADRTGGGPI